MENILIFKLIFFNMLKIRKNLRNMAKTVTSLALVSFIFWGCEECPE